MNESNGFEEQGASCSQLTDRYSPQDVEKRIYAWWENQGYFKAEDTSTKPPFSIILPPPNVTGSLHLGHALDHSIQDCLVRWKRMSGYNVLWLPGTDHAGIATQSVVEKSLMKEGLGRRDLGREKFVEQVWKWKEKHGHSIVDQMKRLGSSCDWERHVFTLDENVSRAVRKVFVDLYKKDWIYRGQRLINWSPQLESALSDLEVEYQEVKGSLWYIKYPVEGEREKLVVATTRPETILGDSAVAVHPDDERYQHLIGKSVLLPLTERHIPIIADKYVDKDFGSGVVKITPAHDFNDYEVGERHGLEKINILNKDGTLNENAGEYQGLKVSEARKRIVADLEQKDGLQKVESHQNSVGHCSRSGCVVEPYLSEQWFVRTSELSLPAIHVAQNGTLLFEPASWTKTYLHWMNAIQDWCISRQLWWGHQIPAWYCGDCNEVTVAELSPEKCSGCGGLQLTQDEDVLDTWFSSGLWPMSTMGWPDSTEAQKTFYPTDILVTGHDIIFFWVARMVMMGLEFKKDIPFRKVYIHGLIRDSKGNKMSKSLNNSIDPVELIDKCGADALRMTLLSQVASGRDLKFSQQRLEGYKNFMNKVWNAARFALASLKDFDGREVLLPKSSALSDADHWIIAKLGECEAEIGKALEQNRFSDATRIIYNFVWHEFCDWYLEFIKPVIYGDQSKDRVVTQMVLAQTFNRMLRLLHPFAPFITEEIYQKLPIKGESIMVDTYPTPSNDRELLALGLGPSMEEMDMVREVIVAIRNIRGENRVKPSEKVVVHLAPTDERAQKILSANKPFIMNLARLKECNVGEITSFSKCAVAPVRTGEFQVDVVVPLEGLVDLQEEVKRITKSIEKWQKEASRLTQRLTNEDFVKNAPEEVVQQVRGQLEGFNSQIKSLQESLQRLS